MDEASGSFMPSLSSSPTIIRPVHKKIVISEKTLALDFKENIMYISTTELILNSVKVVVDV